MTKKQEPERGSTTDGQLQAMLKIDPARAVDRIAETLRRQVGTELGRKGLVLGLSGGVDSSICAALARLALGPDRVLALLMPELDSDADGHRLAVEWSVEVGISYHVEDITPILSASGCYDLRNGAIRRLIPEFEDGWRCKISLGGSALDSDRLPFFHLTVRSPAGVAQRLRLPSREYREIVAATNLKQRVRKMLEYLHADRLHYAVLGTPNRLEFDQGFFVKGGDGLADVKPIAHLYKSQVYQIAEYLGVPRAVINQEPTTGTYSLPQTQEEFYFAMPLRTLDLALLAYNEGWLPERAALDLGLRPDQVARAYREIERRRVATRYLRTSALLVGELHEAR